MALLTTMVLVKDICLYICPGTDETLLNVIKSVKMGKHSGSATLRRQIIELCYSHKRRSQLLFKRLTLKRNDFFRLMGKR